MTTCRIARMVAVATEVNAADLERTLGLIASESINLNAYAADEAGVRLFCDDPERLKQIITNAGMFGQVVEVLSIELDDKPGQLEMLMERLNAEDIQVISMFGMGIKDHGHVFVRVDDPERALAAVE